MCKERSLKICTNEQERSSVIYRIVTISTNPYNNDASTKMGTKVCDALMVRHAGPVDLAAIFFAYDLSLGANPLISPHVSAHISAVDSDAILDVNRAHTSFSHQTMTGAMVRRGMGPVCLNIFLTEFFTNPHVAEGSVAEVRAAAVTVLRGILSGSYFALPPSVEARMFSTAGSLEVTDAIARTVARDRHGGDIAVPSLVHGGNIAFADHPVVVCMEKDADTWTSKTSWSIGSIHPDLNRVILEFIGGEL